MDWALSWGALAYSCYFIASFPMVQWMDESPGQPWTLRKVAENALAASMLAFIMLDMACQFIIPSAPWRGRIWWA